MSWIIGNRKLGLAGGRDVPVQIGVEKSASHHQSPNEMGVIIPVRDSYRFLLVLTGCISLPIGCMMSSARIKIGKILLSALLFLLLFGIVGAEFPELLTLTDNTANDFTVCKAKTAVSHSLPDSRRRVRMTDVDSNVLTPSSTLLRLSRLEKTPLFPSELSILHSVLRT